MPMLTTLLTSLAQGLTNFENYKTHDCALHPHFPVEERDLTARYSTRGCFCSEDIRAELHHLIPANLPDSLRLRPVRQDVGPLPRRVPDDGTEVHQGGSGAD